jgi:hypothetical protein
MIPYLIFLLHMKKKVKICLNLSDLCIDALMHILKIWCILYYGGKNMKVDFHILVFWPNKSWGSLAHKLEHNIFKLESRWKNGKLNQKNILLKMQFLNMAYFNINTRKYIETILKRHYENVYVSIELMANWIQNLKKNNVIKLSSKYALN